MTQHANMERDIISDPVMREKAVQDRSYCFKLYYTLCNNSFQKLEVEPILRDDTWSCSWRYAAGIAAFMHNHGEDYLSYYLNEFVNSENDCPTDTREKLDLYSHESGSLISREIENDLLRLNWIIQKG